MDKWTGFSDEDLGRLKQNSASASLSAASENGRPVRNNLSHDSKLGGVRRSGQQRRSGPITKSPQDLVELLPSSQRLTQSKEHGPESSGVGSKEEMSKLNPSTGTGSIQMPANQKDDKKEKHDSEKNVEADLIVDESSIISRELANLDKFQEQQKMMEELNKKKKAMLTSAINERQKKAKAEATKLSHIKKELDKLDQMVIADVSIIRNRIEEASREYLEAQKRYDRAEKEFIDSKTDLHKKSDYKNQLTEHLYTVIHQNEQRKAKKLSELMEKLEMEAGSEEEVNSVPSSPPTLPMLIISPIEGRKGCLKSLLPLDKNKNEHDCNNPDAAAEIPIVDNSAAIDPSSVQPDPGSIPGVSNPGANISGVSNPGAIISGVSNPGAIISGVSNPGVTIPGPSVGETNLTVEGKIEAKICDPQTSNEQA